MLLVHARELTIFQGLEIGSGILMSLSNTLGSPDGGGGLREAEGVYDWSGPLVVGAEATPQTHKLSSFRALPLKGG